MGREHAREANEMEPGPWDECGQALQEFQRAHHEMGGALAVRGFELEDNLAGPGAAQSFVAKGRARETKQGGRVFDGIPYSTPRYALLFRSPPYPNRVTRRCILRAIAS